MRIAVLLLVLAAVVVMILNRPRQIRIDGAPPQDFPDSGFSHDAFESLLARYVDDNGEVDYETWHRNETDLQMLASYLVAVGLFSPESDPRRFPTRFHELAYWMYAYNASVLYGVLTQWPLDSVTAVRAPIEITEGFGFFYQQRFLFGGRWLNLYTVENRKIRSRYQDPRIHFVLNCASGSCPVAIGDLPTGDELEGLLAKAAREFVGSTDNVRIDHENRVVHLSAIFKWYRKDFVGNDTSILSEQSSALLDYVRQVGPESLAQDLGPAGDYRIEFNEYDWSINAASQ